MRVVIASKVNTVGMCMDLSLPLPRWLDPGKDHFLARDNVTPVFPFPFLLLARVHVDLVYFDWRALS